jgi:hypothetical protein
MFGSNQVTTRQVEKNILKETDLLDLQPQEAYMTSYTGRWALVTEKVPNAKIKVVFPGAPTTLLNKQVPRTAANKGANS